MRIVLQRVSKAKVTVRGETVGEIGTGFLLLVGVTHDDEEKDAEYLAEKVAGLRVFEDGDGKMNLSVLDVGGEVLSVSQFTLYGDARKGRRPNFMAAAKPDMAERLYGRFNQFLREKGLRVETGRFGERMEVHLINNGPVTLILDSKNR
ncbi:D-aminoacyl-tRNA deacylase [Caldibacillus debilis]|uniref:D-aminoacyl-tRNA deacylase n=1 Tax=Caldibacillus debilis TaxID=301148 RepID=UPI00038218CC|nr:D-aminoacyl-tRNA deacylase [Caldibacillus debilis]